MNHELELKVQAWLDGETSDHEAARIADLLAKDAEANALAAELGTVRNTMAGSELVVPLPETREFYWSKIERQIQLESRQPRHAPVSWLAHWRRVMMSLAGVTALACVLITAVKQLHQPTFDEISDTDAGMDAVTFHDQSAEMTVVWLQDNSQTSGLAEPVKAAGTDAANSDVETE
jgi:anti-sigma-K factor RskA